MQQRPNILWLCTEHQRFDTIHALNNPHIHTPNFDRLVNQGVAFTHGFTQCPVCQPSRASFFSGMYPQNTGVCRNGQDIDEDVPLITKELSDAGYECGLAGKFHVRHAYHADERRGEDGFNMFEYSHGVVPMYAADFERWLGEQSKSLDEVYRPGVLQSRRVTDRAHHQTTWCFDHAQRFISHQREGPWLMTIHPFAAHDPYDYLDEFYEHYNPADLPAPRFEDHERQRMTLAQQRAVESSGFDRRGFDQTTDHQRRQMVGAYYACIEHIDHELGRLIDTLEQTGQREDTLILFMADHGDLLGDHGIFAKGPFFYDPVIRVPLIFSWPNGLPANRRIDALVEMVDLAPTLYELAGMDIPERFQGKSLVALMRGQANPADHRLGVYAEHYNHEAQDASATMWREARYKIVVRHGQRLGELYDLQNDPDETHNLWDDPAYATIQAQLTRRCFDAQVLGTRTPAVNGAGF